jgi:hypothetical protein
MGQNDSNLDILKEIKIMMKNKRGGGAPNNALNEIGGGRIV